MRILLYRWKVFNQEDIQEAFANFGYQIESTELIREDIKNRIQTGSREFLEEYDMIFTVNFFSEISEMCNEFGKKYICWTVDSPMISMYHKSVFYECNYIFIFDQFQYYQFKNMGVKHVYYLPLAVNAKRVQRQLAEREYTERFKNEIAFVGGLYHKNSYDAIHDKLSKYLQGYFDAAMMAQMEIYGYNIFDSLLTVDILEQLSELVDFQKDKAAFSDLKLVFTATHLGYKLAQKERIAYLNRLSRKHQVGLYTDEMDAELQNVDFRGTVNYLYDMPKVFHDSAINLNLTIRNIRTGIPLRVWDILGAEGFLLTNYQVELGSYFENGKNIVYFDGIEDCMRKADYYLAHEDERKTIASNGFAAVREEHSYEKRIEKIIAVINADK